jgi:pantoate--beta-alanine ligase
MVIQTNISQAKQLVQKARKNGKSVGFIPTMGALHEGHLSLVREAVDECGFVVVSIFLNPLQFSPKEDLSHYPRDFKSDRKLLKLAGADLLFYPQAKDFYPSGFSTYVEETHLSKVLCGKSRLGHFRGVCTVLVKLFNVINPDIVYFGQKDYQQALIVRRLISDLNFSLKMKILPIVRDKDNLALSSRNAYLNRSERKESLCIYEALALAKELIDRGEKNTKKIVSTISKKISSKKRAKIDYIEIRNAENLNPLDKVTGKVLIALAVYIGKTRLIDNIVLNVKNK